MLHSPFPPPNGILLDTNVLSLLALANKLSSLQLWANASLYVTPHIQQELVDGVTQGIVELEVIFDLIAIAHIQVLALTDTENTRLMHFPKKLGQGEREAIAVCRQRNMVFITRDRKAANYCDREGILCIRLHDLLNEFVAGGLLTALEAAHIVS